jgi:hypothetical protein
MSASAIRMAKMAASIRRAATGRWYLNVLSFQRLNLFSEHLSSLNSAW